jgi:hypothetical protein
MNKDVVEVIAYFKLVFNNFLQRLKKTMKNLCQDNGLWTKN